MVNFPSIEVVQNSLTVDPSGNRHLNGAGYIRTLGTGAGQELNFGQLNTTGSGAISDTKLCYGRLTDLGDASGIFNMRLYLNNITAWDIGTYRFLERKNIHFIPSVTLNSASNNTPTVIPSQPNLSGTVQPGWLYGSPWVSGVPRDQASTEYFWLATEVGIDVNVGTKGGAGAGSWRYRILYDFS